MLHPIISSSASVGAAPGAAHAAAAVEPSTAAAPAAAAPESAQPQLDASHAEQMFRYNSLQFVYRQDIGRIVLIGQSPVTGERIVQVPSEQALRAYEHTVRVERQMARTQGDRAAVPETGSRSAPQLARALVAAVGGDNHGSGVVSVSA